MNEQMNDVTTQDRVTRTKTRRENKKRPESSSSSMRAHRQREKRQEKNKRAHRFQSMIIVNDTFRMIDIVIIFSSSRWWWRWCQMVIGWHRFLLHRRLVQLEPVHWPNQWFRVNRLSSPSATNRSSRPAVVVVVRRLLAIDVSDRRIVVVQLLLHDGWSTMHCVMKRSNRNLSPDCHVDKGDAHSMRIDFHDWLNSNSTSNASLRLLSNVHGAFRFDPKQKDDMHSFRFDPYRCDLFTYS